MNLPESLWVAVLSGGLVAIGYIYMLHIMGWLLPTWLPKE